MYVDGMPKVVLVGQDKYNQQWYQRLIISKNRYPSAMIDRWNGSTVALNTSEGSILSTMIAAGSKND
nr:MAG TPA: uracil DNA glycosylase-like protein [Caudoviricetes sp.]